MSMLVTLSYLYKNNNKSEILKNQKNLASSPKRVEGANLLISFLFLVTLISSAISSPGVLCMIPF